MHRVIDNSDVICYASCSIERIAQAHFDNHVYFKGICCQHIYCLSQVAIPASTLPVKSEACPRDCLLYGMCCEYQPAWPGPLRLCHVVAGTPYTLCTSCEGAFFSWYTV